ncbi:LacI family DNA-binding transcriptional regulator [Neobacillus vireti]|uniref:LacI family transcriptional regulator n=1 Tax=Neobacillus vireti LMG 21834 TaxID=1131730 RepID=A0AB94IIJ4_9BACI|nr:LacI family DNA-binding transcriptional regulator [Neobacillus vireti]ETI66848.1 LacI family transcriptional regulator [Neobacillus vireti LMG 21834]KLT16755.1 DNA-binding protein [Neobacillus vireti]
MLTIKEIAERANVSRTTVSRVINNSGSVSEEARRRVLKVIEETGYVPSENAKSLRTKKTKVIGVILPKISTETSSRLVKGLDDIFAKEGYQILLANTNLNPEKEIEYLRLLKSRHVDGIILSATNINRPLVEEIYQLKIPFVTVGQYITGLANVLFDDYQASKDMVNLLIKNGYKNIAFIGVSEKDRSVGHLRKIGYMDAMKDHHLPVEESWIQKGIFNVDSGYECMKPIMEDSKIKPDAVLAVTDRLAIGALQYIKEKGLSIPDDIAVAGMGASELSKYISPALTTIDFSMEDAGREAASLLLEQINGENYQETIRMIKYRFMEGSSI